MDNNNYQAAHDRLKNYLEGKHQDIQLVFEQDGRSGVFLPAPGITLADFEDFCRHGLDDASLANLLPKPEELQLILQGVGLQPLAFSQDDNQNTILSFTIGWNNTKHSFAPPGAMQSNGGQLFVLQVITNKP